MLGYVFLNCPNNLNLEESFYPSGVFRIHRILKCGGFYESETLLGKIILPDLDLTVLCYFHLQCIWSVHNLRWTAMKCTCRWRQGAIFGKEDRSLGPVWLCRAESNQSSLTPLVCSWLLCALQYFHRISKYVFNVLNISSSSSFSNTELTSSYCKLIYINIPLPLDDTYSNKQLSFIQIANICITKDKYTFYLLQVYISGFSLDIGILSINNNSQLRSCNVISVRKERSIIPTVGCCDQAWLFTQCCSPVPGCPSNTVWNTDCDSNGFFENALYRK